MNPLLAPLHELSATHSVLFLVAGVALARLFYVCIEIRAGGDPRAVTRLAWWSLVGAALVYVVFALVQTAPTEVFALELFGIVIYALLGLQSVSLGWGAHVAWDLLVHGFGPVQSAGSGAYSLACLSFDLYMAARLAALKQ